MAYSSSGIDSRGDHPGIILLFTILDFYSHRSIAAGGRRRHEHTHTRQRSGPPLSLSFRLPSSWWSEIQLLDPPPLRRLSLLVSIRSPTRAPVTPSLKDLPTIFIRILFFEIFSKSKLSILRKFYREILKSQNSRGRSYVTSTVVKSLDSNSKSQNLEKIDFSDFGFFPEKIFLLIFDLNQNFHFQISI